jgi:hypothetical protein
MREAWTGGLLLAGAGLATLRRSLCGWVEESKDRVADSGGGEGAGEAFVGSRDLRRSLRGGDDNDAQVGDCGVGSDCVQEGIVVHSAAVEKRDVVRVPCPGGDAERVDDRVLRGERGYGSAEVSQVAFECPLASGIGVGDKEARTFQYRKARSGARAASTPGRAGFHSMRAYPASEPGSSGVRGAGRFVCWGRW